MTQTDEPTEWVELIEAREAKGLSRTALADELHVDRVTIQRWEERKNFPQSYYHQQLADAVGKTKEELGLDTKKRSARRRSVPSAMQAEETALQPSVPSATHAEEKDTYTTRLPSHLILHLWHLVCNWPVSCARYHELQLRVTLELEDNSTMNPDDVMNRREACYTLVGMPIEWCSLSAFIPVFKRPIEEILTQCAAGITACWYLERKDLVFVSVSIDKYLPTLSAIAEEASSAQRKAAADLLAQCFILKSSLAKHLTNALEGIRYAQEAEKYSKVAENPLLQVVALKRRSAAHWYANQWEQAANFAEKADHLLATIGNAPPILQSYVHSGRGPDLAHEGNEKDARALIDQARQEFAAQPKNEPVPIWIPHSERLLVGEDGLTYLHLGMCQEAFDVFGRIASLPGVPETTRVDALIHQVMAQTSPQAKRSDDLKEMYQCIAIWTAGMEGAKALGSTHWTNQAIVAYWAMRDTWRGEPSIVKLRKKYIEEQ